MKKEIEKKKKEIEKKKKKMGNNTRDLYKVTNESDYSNYL
jgi:hypothetical protein